MREPGNLVRACDILPGNGSPRLNLKFESKDSSWTVVDPVVRRAWDRGYSISGSKTLIPSPGVQGGNWKWNAALFYDHVRSRRGPSALGLGMMTNVDEEERHSGAVW